MVNVPSLLVGSTFAGTGFLLIHREMSHRSRLSSRWAIAEISSERIKKFMQSLKGVQGSSKTVSGNACSIKFINATCQLCFIIVQTLTIIVLTKQNNLSSVASTWNEGVDSTRKISKNVFFGGDKP